jgi:hypothetical protein
MPSRAHRGCDEIPGFPRSLQPSAVSDGLCFSSLEAACRGLKDWILKGFWSKKPFLAGPVQSHRGTGWGVQFLNDTLNWAVEKSSVSIIAPFSGDVRLIVCVWPG